MILGPPLPWERQVPPGQGAMSDSFFQDRAHQSELVGSITQSLAMEMGGGSIQIILVAVGWAVLKSVLCIPLPTSLVESIVGGEGEGSSVAGSCCSSSAQVRSSIPSLSTLSSPFFLEHFYGFEFRIFRGDDDMGGVFCSAMRM